MSMPACQPLDFTGFRTRKPSSPGAFGAPASPQRGEVSISRPGMNLQFLIQLLVNGLVVGTLYGVVAMSFVLIYKATQVVNFAQGELLLVGAWVCWALLTKYQVPFWIGMPLTLVFMFVFGIAIQIVILRPMIGEPIISVIMVTIGLSTVFQALAEMDFRRQPAAVPAGLHQPVREFPRACRSRPSMS